MCSAVGPVAVAPSPKVQSKDCTVPSGSDELVPSKVQVSPAQDDVKLAVGATLGTWTCTCCEVVVVAPRLSVTVSETV